jgi:hypothetical protein
MGAGETGWRADVSPQDRKARSESLLKKEGIPFLPSLPCVKSEAETKLRSAQEVGIRICCLFGVVGYAFELDDPVFKEYLKKNQLCDHLTSNETSFLADPNPTQQSVANFTWQSEAMFLLMWSARLFESLPMPRSETATREIVLRLPSVDKSPWPFIQEVLLRSKAELLDGSDLIYRLHWATRQAGLEGKPPPSELSPGIVQEWHHAINWITRYDDLDWDQVSTDT